MANFFVGGEFCGMLVGGDLILSWQVWSGMGSFVGLKWVWAGDV